MQNLFKRCAFAALAIALTIIPIASPAQIHTDAVVFGKVNIGNGITLHYAEEGRGTPVIFVHGSLSDYSYWKDEVDQFSKHYRAIAYSRRYNYPNVNPARPGYSAVADADDLAAFIKTMHLGRVYVIGHSYGALTTLFLIKKHPELVHAVVLAEPPVVPLLNDLPGDQAKVGKAMFDDIQARMVAPMKRAFGAGDTNGGVGIFINYMFNKPNAWQNMSASAHEETLRDAHEWDVIMTTGKLFPYISAQSVAKIDVPVLIITGAKSVPFLISIDDELARLLPVNQQLVVPKAGHQMWLQNPELCRSTTEAFFSRYSGPAKG